MRRPITTLHERAGRMAQRKASSRARTKAYREKMKQDGYCRVEMWVHQDDIAKIDALAWKLREAREG